MRVLLITFVLLTAPAMAAEPITCPASIEITPQVTVKAVPGWQALPMAEHHQLDGARLFDGNPADMADLVPDQNSAALNVWQLRAGNAYTFVCTYAGTEMTMSAKVPADAKQCTAAKKTLANTRPPNNTYIDASCR